jgi:predicted nucleic acid-binding protein
VIVADASAIAELLLARPRAQAIREVLAEHTEIHVPEHFHVEVLSVLRRYSIRLELSELRAAEALAALRGLRTLSYPVIELVDAVWALRETLTAHDAAYLALAQRLDVGLITIDGELAGAAETDGRLVALTN